MANEHRSGCPINLTLEVLGDKWSLIVIRDIIFGNRRHFRELLTQSEEGIASNVLADRLQRLVEEGVITRSDDKTHSQKVIYSLTERGIKLLPVLVAIGTWGRKFLPVTEELAVRQELLEKGGPQLVEDFMEELRAEHLGKRRPRNKPSVALHLQKEFESVMRRRGKRGGS